MKQLCLPGLLRRYIISLLLYLTICLFSLVIKMAIFSRDPDHPLPDIMITVWLTGCCITSTLLNPLMFVYNYKRPHTVQRVIYTILSVLGFIMCLVAPIVTIPNALSSTDCNGRTYEEQEGGMDITKCMRETRDTEKVYSGISKCCVYLPIILTSILTATRLYHIKFPLRNRRRKEILIATLAMCCAQALFCILPLLDMGEVSVNSTFSFSKVAWWSATQTAHNFDPFRLGGTKAMIWTSLIIMILPFAIQVLGLAATFLTIKQILSISQDPAARQSQRNNAKVTKKILVINTGSLISSIIFIGNLIIIIIGLKPGDTIPDVADDVAWILILYNVLGPCLIYAVNPVVFIAMTTNFKDGIIKGVRRRSTVHVTRISQTVRDNNRTRQDRGTSEASSSAISK